MHCFKLKTILIISFLLFQLIIAIAQPQLVWQKNIGGAYNEKEISFVIDSNDNFLIAAESFSNISGDKTINSYGKNDIWLFMLNKNGNILWQITFGGVLYEYNPKLIKCKNDGYVLAASSMSAISGNKTTINKGLEDYWIIKLDENGNELWQKSYGGSSTDYLTSVIQTSDYGYLLGGYTFSDDGDISSGSTCGQSLDYWIVKIDSSGNIQWDKTIGSYGYDYLMDIAETNNANYIIAGTSYGAGGCEKTENNQGYYSADYWILQLDANGNIVWQNSIGTSEGDEVKKVLVYKNAYYIIGSSNGNANNDKTSNSYGDYDVWVVKLDTNGNVSNQITLGGSLEDRISDASFNENAELIIAVSSFSNISGCKNENTQGSSDYWLLAVDSNLSLLWQKDIGGSSTEFINSMQLFTNGDIACAGHSYSNASGDKTDNLVGSTTYSDIWLTKFSTNTVTSTKSSSFALPALLIYPNPAQSILNIDLNNKDKIQSIKIYSLLGKIVYANTAPTNKQQINVTDYTKGIYVLEIKTEKTFYLKKVEINP